MMICLDYRGLQWLDSKYMTYSHNEDLWQNMSCNAETFGRVMVCW
jgi:hypothetical protein